MLTIQIKNGNNEVIAVVNDIFSLQVDDEVNKGGKLKLRFPTEKRLQKRPVQKADRISVSYGLKIGKTIRLFEGYITDITLQTNEVMIEADNWLSYLQRRMIRSGKTYTGKPINEVISEIFTELNNNKELPVVLGLNDCTTQISKEFDTGTSFYDILKYCREAEPKLVVRVINEGAYNFLECSENGGNVLDGVREYDARNTRGGNIVDWKWKDSMDDFYSFIQNAGGSITNEEFLQRTNLLFENYEEEGALSLPSGIAIPSVSVSRDTDWWDFNIGDRKNIRILTGYDWLPLSYLGLIQSRKVVIDANGGIKAEIKISEDYKADTNILDLVLQNLRGRKGKGGSSQELENYYTKSETVNIINSAVTNKADLVHSHLSSQITDFAQAVSTLITSALGNYYNKSEVDEALSGKSNTGHKHAIADVNNLQDELDDKSDVGHVHGLADVTGLTQALEGKADTDHTHQTSDISGLDSALDSKADKSDTYTKTQTDNLLSQKANSSHTHSVNDINGLSGILNNKADKTDVYDKDAIDELLSDKASSVHSHTIAQITGLQDALNGKANTNHSHTIANITGLQSALDNKADNDDIPTVNDSTITIQVNGNTVKSITLNQANGETINIPVPTKTSEISNDSGFITKAVSDLTNYYTKSQTYTKTEVNNLLDNFTSIEFRIVTSLPATGENGVFYMISNGGSGGNSYDEYVWIDSTSKFEKIGTTDIDLSNYIDKNTPFITINGVAYKFGDSLTTPNTEYDTMTQAQATAGTGDTGLLITPKVLKDTIANMISGKANTVHSHAISDITNLQNELDSKADESHSHAISDITNLQSNLDNKANKNQIKNFAITEDIVTVTTDSTKGVSPYNTSYGYTNITIDADAGIEWIEGAIYTFVVNTEMVVASANRNVRVRIGNGAYIPVMSWSSSILAGSSYFVKTNTRIFVYKTVYQSGGALHMNQDTTYSAISTAEVTGGTSTTARLMTGVRFKEGVQHYLQNIPTPDSDNDAVNKSYVDAINQAIQEALSGKANSTHSHTISQISGLQDALDNKANSSALANYLPLAGGTLTGNLTGQEGAFTYLKTTSATQLSSTPTKIAVLDANGKICWRSPANIKADIGLGDVNNVEIGDGRIGFVYDDEEIGYFTTNQKTNKTIVIPVAQGGSDVTESFVRTMIYAGTGDYDKVFSASTGLYKILNALDELDNLGLTEGETWEDIVVNQTSMSMISHSYSAMVAVASSEYAMEKLLNNNLAVKEISEDWNSISIIAESELASEMYLGSSLGIKYLFTYQTAQDAFFTDNAKKQQIITENIMTIVNDNTLLAMLYNDSTVANAIANSSQAKSVIAGDNTKLNIVQTNSTIMNAIANDSTALGNMSNADFTTYYLESSTYLNTITTTTAGQNRINSMSADALLPAIFFWTGLSGYSTFEELASSDGAMEIVQSDTESMLIISQNEEAMSYMDWMPTENTIGYRPLIQDFNDKLGNYNLSNKGSTTISTIGGIKGALFSNALTSGLYHDNIPIPSGNSAKTINLRMYPTSYNTAEEDAIFIGNGGAQQQSRIIYNINPLSFSQWGGSVSSSNNIELNKRTNVIISTNGNNIYMYINGQQVKTGTLSINTQGNKIAIGFGRQQNDTTTHRFIGYINRVILEKIFRSSTDANQYFTKMKGKYGY